MTKRQEFEIIIHFPDTEEEMTELRRRVAIIQAQAVLTKISKLPIPTDQKLQLVDAIIADQKMALKKLRKSEK